MDVIALLTMFMLWGTTRPKFEVNRLFLYCATSAWSSTWSSAIINTARSPWACELC